ncbi:hypothetical protein [Kitasatospora cineracea]|uniref:hypothetical protein n=1 Tax=Kitasatospora cineracea TaxID=88074 RepID=UPI00380F4C1C
MSSGRSGGETHQQALAAVDAGGVGVGIPTSDELRSADAWDHRQGGNGVLCTCPECELDTLVDNIGDVLPKQPGPDVRWFCFHCLLIASASDLDECMVCGQPTTDTETSMCGNCVEWQMG